MRAVLLALLFAAACDDHGSTPPDGRPGVHDARIDAAFDAGPDSNIDAYIIDYNHCDVATGTANIMMTGPGGTQTFHRLYAGGETGFGALRRTGEGAPTPESAPSYRQTIALLFTDDEVRNTPAELACMKPDGTCTMPGVVVETPDQFEPFQANGMHIVVGSDTPTALHLDGSITVDDFSSPLMSLPGHVSGSVNAATADGVTTVTGTFDNVFCPGLVVYLF